MEAASMNRAVRHQLAHNVAAAIAKAHAADGHLAKAAEYEEKAKRLTDPEMAHAYRQLAADERAKAGCA
jgi:hypothetical protein